MYTTRIYHSCIAGCILNYLNAKKEIFSEFDVLGLGEGVYLFSDNSQYEEAVPGLDIWGSCIGFCNAIGAALECDKLTCNYQQYLSEKISHSESVMIMVSVKDLGYHIREVTSDAHWINVIGETKDEFIISDSFVALLVCDSYEGKIPKEILIESWKKMNGTYIVLNWDVCIYEKNKEQLNSRIFNNFLDGLEKFLIEDEEGVCQGINTILKLKDSIKEIFSYHENLIERARYFSERLTVSGFFVFQYACYVFAKTHVEDNPVLIQEFEKVYTLSYGLKFQLCKASISRKEKDINRIYESLEQIYWLEKKCMADLLRIKRGC